MMKLILEAKDLRKGYGDRELFYIESLTVYEGERIGIIGQNGAGKSTLIHLLSGEEKPDEGTVRRFGETAVIAQQGIPEEDSEGIYRSLFCAQDNRDSLSGGEQTRNRIAAALSSHPGAGYAGEAAGSVQRRTAADLTRPGAAQAPVHPDLVPGERDSDRFPGRIRRGYRRAGAAAKPATV